MRYGRLMAMTSCMMLGFSKPRIGGASGRRTLPPLHRRVHVGLWAAQNAISIEGDLVECDVSRGFLSSAIMNYLNWNAV